MEQNRGPREGQRLLLTAEPSPQPLLLFVVKTSQRVLDDCFRKLQNMNCGVLFPLVLVTPIYSLYSSSFIIKQKLFFVRIRQDLTM